MTLASVQAGSVPVSPAIIIGAGPAGLMAAETLINSGVRVDLYDAMPSAGRKFLVAGKGGLNLTHSEPFEQFLSHYGDRREQLEPLLRLFGPEQLRGWAASLGMETFVGTSNRVFPLGMKSAPLLRLVAGAPALFRCSLSLPPQMGRMARRWLPALRNTRR